MGTIELEDCSCKETSKGITDLLRDIEAGKTLAEFSFSVPLERNKVSTSFYGNIERAPDALSMPQAPCRKAL